MYFQPDERLLEIKNSKGKRIKLKGPIDELPKVEFSGYIKIQKGEVQEQIIEANVTFHGEAVVLFCLKICRVSLFTSI